MSYVTEGPSSKLCVLLRGNETSEWIYVPLFFNL